MMLELHLFNGWQKQRSSFVGQQKKSMATGFVWLYFVLCIVFAAVSGKK